MKSAGWLLASVLLVVSTLSCVKSNTTSTTTGFVWVATQGNQQVTAFTIDLNNGALTQAGSSQSTGVQPSAMVITPDGKTLFIANTSDNTISSYTVNSDGSLAARQSATSTVAQGTSMTLGLNPVALAVDPSSALLFVADEGLPNDATAPGGISVFTISGTSLSPAGPACPAGFAVSTCPFVIADPVTGFGTGPSAVLAAPVANFLYVANSIPNTVQSFSYDASGNLVALGSPYATGNNPSALAFSRCAGVSKATTYCAAADGNTLFVANSGSNTVSTFAACIQASGTCATPDGSLVQTSGSPVAAGISPAAFMVNPAANFVYVVNSKANTVSQYRYSNATGALSALSTPSISTGVSPFGGGVTSNGSYALVTNNNGSSLSVYVVATSTTTTSSGNIGFLGVPGTPNVTLAGQPSAIVVR